MTLAQANAALTATRRSGYVETSRRAALTQARDLLLAGQPADAYAVLVAATEACARVGDSDVDLGTAWDGYIDCLQRMEG